MSESWMIIYQCSGCTKHVSEFMIFCSDECRRVHRLYQKLCNDEVDGLTIDYVPVDNDVPFPSTPKDRFGRLADRARTLKRLASGYPDPADD